MANLSSELNISSRSIIRVFLWTLFFYGLYYFRELILILFLSIIIASVVDRIAQAFKKFNIPRSFTVVSMYLILSFLFLSGFYFLIPLLAEYINVFIQKIPSIIEAIKESVKAFGQDSSLATNLSNKFSNFSKDLNTTKLFEIRKNAILAGDSTFISGTISGVVNFILVIVLSFYLSIEERSVQKFLKLVVGKAYEEYIVSLWDRSQAKITAWFIGQVSIAIFMSIIIFIILSILNIPFAFPIAVIAFFGEMIPIVGLSISGVVASILAWGAGGMSLFIVVLITFLILSQFESHFLYPKVMGKAVGLPTVIVILVLVLGGAIGGFWGVVIAIPASSFFVELLSDFDKKKKREWEDVY